MWAGPPPASDEEASATFDKLARRYLDAKAPVAPTREIAAFVQVLLARYPDLADSDDGPQVPWGSGPLIGNASGPIVYLDMKLNTVFEEGWRYCVETVVARGLVAFDPQSGTVANPDPNAPSATDVQLSPRGGRLYRWLSLRSWRWPFLRPLLPLVRRFSRD